MNLKDITVNIEVANIEELIKLLNEAHSQAEQLKQILLDVKNLTGPNEIRSQINVEEFIQMTLKDKRV